MTTAGPYSAGAGAATMADVVALTSTSATRLGGDLHRPGAGVFAGLIEEMGHLGRRTASRFAFAAAIVLEHPRGTPSP